MYFTVAKIQNHLRCPSYGMVKEMWYAYIMEYYSAIKTIEILPFSAKWTQLQDIIGKLSWIHNE